jgi:hypothetical protein
VLDDAAMALAGGHGSHWSTVSPANGSGVGWTSSARLVQTTARHLVAVIFRA